MRAMAEIKDFYMLKFLSQAKYIDVLESIGKRTTETETKTVS